jgi:pilus assembly protein Flp/PilA
MSIERNIKNHKGTTAIEYALLALIIAVALILGMISVSGSLSNTFCSVSFGLAKTSCASGSGSGSLNGSSSGSSSTDGETAAYNDLSKAVDFSDIEAKVNDYIAAWKVTEQYRQIAKTAYDNMNTCNASSTTGCSSEQDAFNEANNNFNTAKNNETPLASDIMQGLASDINNFGSAFSQAEQSYGVDDAISAANNVLQQTITDPATGNSFSLNTMYTPGSSTSDPGAILTGSQKTGGGNFYDDLMGVYPEHLGWIE